MPLTIRQLMIALLLFLPFLGGGVLTPVFSTLHGYGLPPKLYQYPLCYPEGPPVFLSHPVWILSFSQTFRGQFPHFLEHFLLQWRFLRPSASATVLVWPA